MTFRCRIDGIALAAVLVTGALPVSVAQPCWAALARDEAAIVSKQAKTYYDSGQFAMAAELYRRAFQIDPARVEYLYGVARSEQRAGRLDLAQATFEQLLAVLSVTHPLRGKAEKGLEEVRLARAQAQQPPSGGSRPEPAGTPQPAPPQARSKPEVSAPPPVDPSNSATPPVAPGQAHAETVPPAAPAVLGQVDAQNPPSTRISAGWVVLYGAAAVGLAAGGLAAWAAASTASLDGDRGRITGDQAFSQQTTINNLSTASALCGGVALAAAGVGVWLIAVDKPVAVVPTATGAALIARF